MQVLDQEQQPLKQVVLSYGERVSVTPKTVAVMDQVERQFEPRILAIQQGQSVSFPNSDDIRHHVYSFSKPNTFEIRLYKGVPTNPIVFDAPGIVSLGCNIHDQMNGHIYVSDGRQIAITDSKGFAKLSSEPMGKVLAWHPRLSLDQSQRVEVSMNKRDSDGAYIIRLELLPLPKQDQKKRGFRKRFGDK